MSITIVLVTVICWFILETLELIFFYNFYRNRYADFLYQILKIGVSFLFILLCIFSLLASHLSDNIYIKISINISLLVTVIGWFIFESIIFYKLKFYRYRDAGFQSQILKIGDIFLWIFLGIFLTQILPDLGNSYRIFFITTALLVRWFILEVIIIYKLYRDRDAGLPTQILKSSVECLFLSICVFSMRTLPLSNNFYRIISLTIALCVTAICWFIIVELITLSKLYRDRDADFRSQILKISFSFLFFILLCTFSLTQYLPVLKNFLPPSPSLSLSSSAQSEISKIFESLPKGLFVYSCSKEMTVGIPETCTARIANDKYLSNFRKAINKGLNQQYIEEIKLQYVNSIMSVKLTGKNFEIELKGNAEDQVIEDRSFSSWQWDVTPREAGMQKLDFIVSVILRIPG
jgi:hypothetical protein